MIGDIAGSRFEFHNLRSKDFEIFSHRSFFTDDTVMSLAVCAAIMDDGDGDLSAKAVRHMQEIGRFYPNCGFGGMFGYWIFSDDPQPYNSFGNGSAMRVSACGLAASSMAEAKQLSDAVTKVTHSHPEGMKGAEATACAIWLAKSGADKDEIRKLIVENYYPLDFTIDQIRPTYQFNETCQNTVPQAIEAFLESDSFEDAIRTAVSVGGDSDTLAAITGGIAEAFYGVPKDMYDKALTYLDKRLLGILTDFEKKYPTKIV